MTKKLGNRILTLITAIAVILLIFFQLNANKTEMRKMANLANEKGRFYPVKSQKVSQTIYKGKLETSGFLEPKTDLYVLSETQGRVVNIYKKRGDNVIAGDVIAQVDDELLQAQLTATKAAIEQLERDEKRFMRLQKENAVTHRQLEDVQLNLKTTQAKYVTAVRQLNDTKIKAPVSGLINEDFIEMGQFLGGGEKVCNILDISTLKTNVFVSARELQFLKKGQRAIIRSATLPEHEFEGNVLNIAEKAGAGNTFNVEIALNNTANKILKAGMYVNVIIHETKGSEKILIPRRAINGSLKDPSVFLVLEEKAILKNVVAGNSIDDMVEIVGGLKEGDEIVVAGNYNIFDGATVKVINF